MNTTKILVRNLLLLGFFLVAHNIIAQTEQSKQTDIVYLKNGSIFRGKIIMYEIGNQLELKIETGKTLIFKDEYIKKVVQNASESGRKFKKEKIYNFKEKGLYFASSIGYIGGNEQFGNYRNGLSAHHITGYQIHRLLGVGLGVGVDYYNVNLGTVIPVYGEARSYLKATNVSPYLSLAGGIGFPVLPKNSFVSETNAGIFVHPSIGFRFGGSENANITASLGLQWQKATYIQTFSDGLTQNKDRYTFKRFTFSVGVLF